MCCIPHNTNTITSHLSGAIDLEQLNSGSNMGPSNMLANTFFWSGEVSEPMEMLYDKWHEQDY